MPRDARTLNRVLVSCRSDGESTSRTCVTGATHVSPSSRMSVLLRPFLLLAVLLSALAEMQYSSPRSPSFDTVCTGFQRTWSTRSWTGLPRLRRLAAPPLMPRGDVHIACSSFLGTWVPPMAVFLFLVVPKSMDIVPQIPASAIPLVSLSQHLLAFLGAIWRSLAPLSWVLGPTLAVFPFLHGSLGPIPGCSFFLHVHLARVSIHSPFM